VFSFIDPLTYGVDALRGLMIGSTTFPLVLDFFILGIVSIAMVLLSAYAFKTGEAI
jgi:ABC-2 type transport system permease protein